MGHTAGRSFVFLRSLSRSSIKLKMALLFQDWFSLMRANVNLVKRCVATSSVKQSSSNPYETPFKPEKIHEGKYFTDEVEKPDLLAFAVGEEKYELLAAEHGDDDPWNNNKIKGTGSFQDPNLVASMFEKRLVGCICDEDSYDITWMTVWRGEPKRCECGNWYKLVSPAPKPYADI